MTELPYGTIDLFLWGQFSSGSADYDQIYGVQLMLTTTGPVTFTSNVAYRHKWGTQNSQRRWDGTVGLPLNHGVMAAVVARGIVNVPPSDPNVISDLYIKADRTFLIGAVRVTVNDDCATLTASLDDLGIAVRDPNGNVYDPDPIVLPAVATHIGAPPPGACCYLDGTCEITLPGDCQGDWHGCSGCNVCPPAGACCFADGHCESWTALGCDYQGGTYQGDGTSCTPNNCPQPTGACCLGYAGICQILTAAGCGQAGGRFRGVGTACAPATCGCPGDCNCDGVVTFDDINPFVAVLGGTTPCNFYNCDLNGDGLVNFDDINPFVVCLSGNCDCP